MSSDVPAIIGMGYTVPPFYYTQKEVFDSLGYSRHWFRMFDEAGIDKRHFLFPLQQIEMMTFQEQQEAYAHWSCILSARALEETVSPEDFGRIGLLVYHSCTGFMPGPTVGHYLADRFGMQDVEICNIASMGCDASWPGLRRCYDYTRLTGRLSVLIACELSDLTYYPEADPPDRENDFELMRANAIFGDACSCTVVGSDGALRHPEIIDFASTMDTRYIDRLGYTWRDGRLRVRLARDVPEIAQKLAVAAIKKLLEKNGVELEDIAYWIIHPAGSSILDGLQQHYNLPDAKMRHSREALRNFGNCSSAAIGIVGKILLQNEPDPRGYAVMVNIGPGMSGNSILLLFP
jgi:alkylresorcinol/alkylpyrone synthase